MSDPSPPPAFLDSLSPESRSCIKALQAYRPLPLRDFGLVKQAAVLVALFERPGDKELSVLLTTRAKTLRSHPNQTALPGGRVDDEDESPIHTARREAFEEVGLPLEHPAVHYITTLDPVITVLPLNAHHKNHIVVTPVVCLISDPSLIASLHPAPAEVDRIFTHPLRALHTGQPEGKDAENLAEKGGEFWPHEEEYHSADDRVGVTGHYRMHRFRTTHSPIKGLTSDVLINTATIAYRSPPLFRRYAADQLPFETLIQNVVAELPNVIDLVTDPKDRKPLEWGTIDGGSVRSGETWHSRA